MEFETHMGTESLEPDGFMQPRRYRVTLRCLRCNHTYSRVVKNITGANPPCPRKACKAAALEEEVEKRARNMARILETGKAPGHIGENVTVKAIDETASVVMQDYGLTDLKDSIRPGESMAPKLPPAQQAQADGFFGGEAVRKRNNLNKRQMDNLGRRAMAGAFRGMAVNPTSVVPGSRGESPLRIVGTERIK